MKEIKRINNFNAINVKNVALMFGECNVLKNLNLSNFNTSKVGEMTSMFDECNELEYLDLSNFDSKETFDTSYMFINCYKLKEIKGIENFDIDHLNLVIVNAETY